MAGNRADIFAVKADVLVNPVNTAGAMAGGLARQFATRFPAIVPAYEQACRDNSIVNGQAVTDRSGMIIYNFPTMLGWNPSTLAVIRQGLANLHAWSDAHPDLVIAIPKIGSGIGGLNWQDVRPLIVAAFEHAPGRITIVE